MPCELVVEMEKFCLKWNDFQTTVSQSYKTLRKEKNFNDVTLISEDQKQIQSHKVVLAACSDFFKSILEVNIHSNPLIYLSGINSTNLQFVMDYIYEGEVKLFQEQLDSFLSTAQKLMIAGLLSKNDQNENLSNNSENFDGIKLRDEFDYGEAQTFPSEVDKEKLKPQKTLAKVALSNHDPQEVSQKIKDNLIKEDGFFKCAICGKSSKLMHNVKNHIATHIDGLSFECSSCNNTFKTSESLRFHKRKFQH